MDLWVIFGQVFGQKDAITAPFVLYLKYLQKITEIFLTPINEFLNDNFPDLSNLITMFDDFLENYIAPFINYFFHLLPPNSMNILLIYVSTLGILFFISIGTHLLIKTFEIIRTIKFW